VKEQQKTMHTAPAGKSASSKTLNSDSAAALAKSQLVAKRSAQLAMHCPTNPPPAATVQNINQPEARRDKASNTAVGDGKRRHNLLAQAVEAIHRT
jgi:broad specificity polyphosphatase/5'/3'-nucleotidase SurE